GDGSECCVRWAWSPRGWARAGCKSPAPSAGSGKGGAVGGQAYGGRPARADGGGGGGGGGGGERGGGGRRDGGGRPAPGQPGQAAGPRALAERGERKHQRRGTVEPCQIAGVVGLLRLVGDQREQWRAEAGPCRERAHARRRDQHVGGGRRGGEAGVDCAPAGAI